MITFFARFISPSSSTRAKLSVHLVAQAKPKEPSADEKKSNALSIFSNILEQEKIVSDISSLKSNITDTADPTGLSLSEAIISYVNSELKLPQEQSEKIVDEVKAALGVADVDSKLEDLTVLQNGDVDKAIKAQPRPVLITDVHAFKAGLQLSIGIQPVKDLAEFVEDSAKL